MKTLWLRAEAEDSAKNDDNDGDKLNCEDEDEGGLGDGRDGMSEEEVAELAESIVPVQLLLTKVSQFELSFNDII